jgi:hypothetical protein
MRLLPFIIVPSGLTLSASLLPGLGLCLPLPVRANQIELAARGLPFAGRYIGGDLGGVDHSRHRDHCVE